MADFDVGTPQVTFAAGVETVCFNVPILEDDITEDNETCYIQWFINVLIQM